MHIPFIKKVVILEKLLISLKCCSCAGVDDAFLMIHPWHRLALHSNSVSKRLGLVFEEVGPSITITSLTNFISFSIGALTPTPGKFSKPEKQIINSFLQLIVLTHFY